MTLKRTAACVDTKTQRTFAAMSVDDYTLAAFLAGELPERERRTVAASLVADQDAREILHMACEALSAAFTSESAREDFRLRASRPPARPKSQGRDRTPKLAPGRTRSID